jgi:hypothetical protein
LETRDNFVTVSKAVTQTPVTMRESVTENANENNSVTDVTDVTVSEGGEP